jgi:DNA-binding MarR family transcriptional regulator
MLMSRNAMHEAGVPGLEAAPVPGQGGGLCNCQALRRAARRATALYDTIMAPHGLRISQFAVLNRLHLGGPAGIQALAAGLVLDRTTLGRNLRPLERDGLIRSEAEPGDRRVRRLVLTEAGLAALTGARPAWDAAQAQFEASYGAADAAVLRAALHRVTEVLEAPSEPHS